MPLSEDVIARIDATLDAGEDRNAFICKAIEGELTRRRPSIARSTMDAGTRAHLLANAISRDLQLAAAAFEVYAPSGQDRGLIDFVNENGLSAAYNVISETLHQASILALCRNWDQGEHVASLKALLDVIGSPEVFRFYEERGTVDYERLKALKASYWKTFNSAEVQALMRMRHTRLAHTATREGPSHKRKAKQKRSAVYGDERRVLELTLPIAIEAAAMVQSAFIPASDLRAIWNCEAAKFWTRLRGDP